ncbi:hypothetical protein GXW82_43400 [Streptacidiphilus sp. 4-A2]|nr:hypothetical protein [Streptacidiphilus sp. 4-A2]
MGHVTSITLDPLRGLTLSSTDAAGYVTSGQYDALGRTTAEFAPGVTAAAVKYTYSVSDSVPRPPPLRPSTTTTAPTAAPKPSMTRCCAPARRRPPPRTAAATWWTPSTTPTD